MLFHMRFGGCYALPARIPYSCIFKGIAGEKLFFNKILIKIV
jgi:hypothetical protein